MIQVLQLLIEFNHSPQRIEVIGQQTLDSLKQHLHKLQEQSSKVATTDVASNVDAIKAADTITLGILCYSYEHSSGNRTQVWAKQKTKRSKEAQHLSEIIEEV
jgi:hypothetical protein